MTSPILIAGIGNIFKGDDGFGVAVVQELAATDLAKRACIMDAGIRGIDLCFALLDPRVLTILIDATQRGGAPGTLYAIEIDPEQIGQSGQETELPNSHGLDPIHVLALAKQMGARFGRLLLVGCEPLTIDCDESGNIGLSSEIQSAVRPAAQMVRDLVQDFEADIKETSTHAVI